MPNKEGKGSVDYVLRVDDGKPLGLVKARRSRRDARVGQRQSKRYADCLERIGKHKREPPSARRSPPTSRYKTD